MSDEEKRQLEKQLWGVANVLRGKMNADEYKNYILGFIFYKYLSEKLERYVDEKLLASEDFTFAEIKENTKEGKQYLEHIKKGCIGHLGFFLKPTELFSYLVKKGKGETKDQSKFILEDLKNVLNTIERTSMGTASEDDFKGLFDDVDLTSTKLGSRENQKNEVIIEVLTLLSGIDFKLEDSKSDLLGDAYEYLIGEFAAGAGKKGGEFYTPAQVSRLLAQIVSEGKKRLRSVYDPTCGSGSLLLRAGDYTDVVEYYGQELNPTTYNLARMNMILHGVHFDHFDIRQGDTLTEDMHVDLKAEAIVANPPFAAKWKSDIDPAIAHDNRFSQYGRLAPRGCADYAFVTHMLYHLSDNGIMAIVLPHGVLFRSGAEGHIRKYIIEKQNYLDAVIGLPSNLFYGTSIPATVLVFKKCRQDDEDILFIDASKDYEKGKNQNKLTNENIKKIFKTYKDRNEIEKYSHRANLDEIKENEYSLNIPCYIDTFKEEEIVNIKEIVKTLSDVTKIEEKIKLKVYNYCKELKVPKPRGNNLYLLKKYKKGILQKLLNGYLRFPEFKQTKLRVRDGYIISKLGGFPEDWELKQLHEILWFQEGPGVRTSQFTKEGVKLLNGTNIQKNNIMLDNTNKYISTAEANGAYKHFLADSGDMIIACSGISVDKFDEKVAFIKDIHLPLCMNTSTMRFKSLDENILDIKFFSYFIRTQIFKNQIRRQITGSAQLNFGPSHTSKFYIFLPQIQEQRKIAGFLCSLDNLIKSMQQKITQTEEWKKGLMQ